MSEFEVTKARISKRDFLKLLATIGASAVATPRSSTGNFIAASEKAYDRDSLVKGRSNAMTKKRFRKRAADRSANKHRGVSMIKLKESSSGSKGVTQKAKSSNRGGRREPGKGDKVDSKLTSIESVETLKPIEAPFVIDFVEPQTYEELDALMRELLPEEFYMSRDDPRLDEFGEEVKELLFGREDEWDSKKPAKIGDVMKLKAMYQKYPEFVIARVAFERVRNHGNVVGDRVVRYGQELDSSFPNNVQMFPAQNLCRKAFFRGPEDESYMMRISFGVEMSAVMEIAPFIQQDVINMSGHLGYSEVLVTDHPVRMQTFDGGIYVSYRGWNLVFECDNPKYDRVEHGIPIVIESNTGKEVRPLILDADALVEYMSSKEGEGLSEERILEVIPSWEVIEPYKVEHLPGRLVHFELMLQLARNVPGKVFCCASGNTGEDFSKYADHIPDTMILCDAEGDTGDHQESIGADIYVPFEDKDELMSSIATAKISAAASILVSFGIKVGDVKAALQNNCCDSYTPGNENDNHFQAALGTNQRPVYTFNEDRFMVYTDSLKRLRGGTLT